MASSYAPLGPSQGRIVLAMALLLIIPYLNLNKRRKLVGPSWKLRSGALCITGNGEGASTERAPASNRSVMASLQATSTPVGRREGIKIGEGGREEQKMEEKEDDAKPIDWDSSGLMYILWLNVHC